MNNAPSINLKLILFIFYLFYLFIILFILILHKGFHCHINGMNKITQSGEISQLFTKRKVQNINLWPIIKTKFYTRMIIKCFFFN